MGQNKKLPFNSLLKARLLHEMLHTARTSRWLIEFSGMGRHAVQRYLYTLRKAKVVYVAGWAPDKLGRRTLRTYMVGDKLDVPQPSKNHAQSCRESRARRRGEMPTQRNKEQAEWAGVQQ